MNEKITRFMVLGSPLDSQEEASMCCLRSLCAGLQVSAGAPGQSFPVSSAGFLIIAHIEYSPGIFLQWCIERICESLVGYCDE